MSIMVGVGRGASLGVLIKNAEALERMEKVDTLVVDKTGTLTEGRPTVTDIVATGRHSPGRPAPLCRRGWNAPPNTHWPWRSSRPPRPEASMFPTSPTSPGLTRRSRRPRCRRRAPGCPGSATFLDLTASTVPMSGRRPTTCAATAPPSSTSASMTSSPDSSPSPTPKATTLRRPSSTACGRHPRRHAHRRQPGHRPLSPPPGIEQVEAEVPPDHKSDIVTRFRSLGHVAVAMPATASTTPPPRRRRRRHRAPAPTSHRKRRRHPSSRRPTGIVRARHLRENDGQHPTEPLRLRLQRTRHPHRRRRPYPVFGSCSHRSSPPQPWGPIERQRSR